MRKYLKNNKGFTLIELLVVVAIISLLSSVVMSSLSSARDKAKDATIKEEVSQFGNLLTLNYNDYGSYLNLDAYWVDAYGSCDSLFSGTYAIQAREICNIIFNNAKNPWGDQAHRICLY